MGLHTVWDPQAQDIPRHPNPLWERENWISLDGLWDFCVVRAGAGDPAGIGPGEETASFPEQNLLWPEEGAPGKIRVPFCPESEASGIGRVTQPDEYLWYRRTLPVRRGEGRVLLHFEAVDQTAAVYVNGRRVCVHTGGYLPFEADITEALGEGENELLVRVRDVSDTSYHARGKQKLARGGMWYTPVSGIWRSVWLEEVPERRLTGVRILPDAEEGAFEILVSASGEEKSVRVTVYEAGLFPEADKKPERVLLCREVRAGCPERISLPEPRLWDPDHPWLYWCRLSLPGEGETDAVWTYFALRSVRIETIGGFRRITLNGEECFQKGVLDQGYWPESLLTPPCDAALVFDIEEMKATGFNMVRKHIKVEDRRWYYHCDRLGILVWQDMVSGGTPYQSWFVTYLATPLSRVPVRFSDRHRFLLSRTDAAGRKEFEEELEETIRVLGGHPSIVTWVIFNEGWGQFDTKRLTERAGALDPSRLIDSASGWYDQRCGDFVSEHNYFFRYRVLTEKVRASVLSEFGGKAFAVRDHVWNGELDTYGYGTMKTMEELQASYDEMDRQVEALREKGLCASVYTQWSDIEDEINGIYTYDRRVRKIGAARPR